MPTPPPASYRLSRRLPGVAADPRHLFPRLAGSRHAAVVVATGLSGEALRVSALLDAAGLPDLVVHLAGDVAVLETPGQRRFLEGRAPLAAIDALLEPLGEPARLPASDGLPLGPFGTGLVGLVRGLPDGRVDGALFLADRAVRVDRVTGGVEAEILAATSDAKAAASSAVRAVDKLGKALAGLPGRTTAAKARAAAMQALIDGSEPFEPGGGGAGFVVDGPEGGVVFPHARAVVVYELGRLTLTPPPATVAEHGLYDGLRPKAGPADRAEAIALVEAVLARRAEAGIELPCLLTLSTGGSLTLLAPETEAVSAAPVVAKGKRRRAS